jgi:cytoskeletal protein RodZ
MDSLTAASVIDTFTKDSVCGSTFPSTATVVFDMFLATSVDVSLLVVSRFIVTLASGRVFVIDTFAAEEAARVNKSITTDATVNESMTTNATENKSITTDATVNKSITTDDTVNKSITTDARVNESMTTDETNIEPSYKQLEVKMNPTSSLLTSCL